MRIGVLGGTFNPIHSAHMQMAQLALSSLSLDKVLFMVAADPPHKAVAGHVPAETRLHMTALASASLPGAEACDLELSRSGKSYTADTLALLAAQYPGATLYLIVGSDMLLDFPTWYHPERIVSLAHIACVPRRGQSARDEAAAEALRTAFLADVTFLPAEADELSSTEIRTRFADALPVDGLLPAAVERYCYETGVYWPAPLRRTQALLRGALSEKRYRHTVGCVQTAVRLAALWGANAGQARLAALLHDCAKCLDPVTLEVLSGDDSGVASVWHAFAGAVVAHNVYGVTDDAVLRAIRLHTTGDAGMTALDSVVFYADLIEPGRSYPSVALLRDAVARGPAAAVLLGLRRTRTFVAENGGVFHPASQRAIAYFEHMEGTD